MKLCSIENCVRPEFRTKWTLCTRHYRRFNTYGSVEPRSLSDAYRERNLRVFLSLVEQSCNVVEGCWEHATANKSNTGYTKVNIDGQSNSLHRFVAAAVHYEFSIKGMPAVHHSCANRACANPAHLQLVTQRENTAEMLERRFYLKQIDDLKAALAAFAPEHPLLRR